MVLGYPYLWTYDRYVAKQVIWVPEFLLLIWLKPMASDCWTSLGTPKRSNGEALSFWWTHPSWETGVGFYSLSRTAKLSVGLWLWLLWLASYYFWLLDSPWNHVKSEVLPRERPNKEGNQAWLAAVRPLTACAWTMLNTLTILEQMERMIENVLDSSDIQIIKQSIYKHIYIYIII